jgi:hypothetical protein
MSTYSQTRRVTHLRFDVDRIETGYFVMVMSNIVWSLGWIEEITMTFGMVQRIRFI